MHELSESQGELPLSVRIRFSALIPHSADAPQPKMTTGSARDVNA